MNKALSILFLLATLPMSVGMNECGPVISVTIESPTNGTMTTAPGRFEFGNFIPPGHIEVTGTVSPAAVPGQSQIRVGGARGQFDPNDPTRWGAIVPVSASAIFNRIAVRYSHTATDTADEEVLILVGQSVADDGFYNDALYAHLTTAGFDVVNAIAQRQAMPMVVSQLNQHAPPGLVLDEGGGTFDYVMTLETQPLVHGVDVALTNTSSTIRMTLDLNDFWVAADVAINNLPDCKALVQVDQVRIVSDFNADPIPADPARIRVRQTGNPTISVSSFERLVNCNSSPVPGASAFAKSKVKEKLDEKFADKLYDKMLEVFGGTGDTLLSSELTSALEEANLGRLDSAINAALGVTAASHFSAVTESTAGLTVGVGTKFESDCGFVPDAAKLHRTYLPAPNPPVFPPLVLHNVENGVMVDISGDPPYTGYSLGVTLSPGAINQFLRAKAECGLLSTTVSTLPGTSIALTSGILSVLMPGFIPDDPASPARIEVFPYFAPIVTADPGPNGELAEVRIDGLIAQVIDEHNPARNTDDEVLVQAVISTTFGVDMRMANTGDRFELTLATPDINEIGFRVAKDVTGADLTNLQAQVLGEVVGKFTELADALTDIEVPELEVDNFALVPDIVNISRVDGHFAIFSVVPEPVHYCDENPQNCTNGVPDQCKILPISCNEGLGPDPCLYAPELCAPPTPCEINPLLCIGPGGPGGPGGGLF